MINYIKNTGFKNLCLSFYLFFNKILEIEFIFCKDYYQYFCFNCDCSRKSDHAGFNLTLGLLWFVFKLSIVDCRHWDYEENKWKQ